MLHPLKRFGVLVLIGLAITSSLVGCGPKAASTKSPDSASAGKAKALPNTAYYLKPDLKKWIDPETKYDTTRTWKLEGGEWPVMLVISPSQAPQLLAGWDAGIYQRSLGKLGITPKLQRLDGPPRVFHALERSQWPFVYMPLAVFMDYSRAQDNQGGAGGLQYVAIAGSTSGGGYTLLTRDPSITDVKSLKGKSVGFLNTNPVPGTLLTKAATEAGLSEKDITYRFGEAGDQMNKYGKGELDAIVSLNIYKAQLVQTGSRIVTDFAGVDYEPNYTILCVERSVLEKRPEVVEAFLDAHIQGQKIAEREWSRRMPAMMLASWNGFFSAQDTNWSRQRTVPNTKAYDAMLGNMWPDMRLDRDLIDDCFSFNAKHKTWGWPGSVDTNRLVDYDTFNRVLTKRGERVQ